MELYNENIFFHDRNAMKKNPIIVGSSKKKALSDVRNTIHLKNRDINSQPSKSNFFPFSKSNHTDNFQNKSELKNNLIRKTYSSYLDSMDDNFFIECSCSEKYIDENYDNALLEDLRLTNNDINIFATKWANKLDFKFDDEFFIENSEHNERITDISIPNLYFSTEVNGSYLDLCEKDFDIAVPNLSCLVMN